MRPIALLLLLALVVGCDSTPPMEKLRERVITAAVSGTPAEAMVLTAKTLFDSPTKNCTYAAEQNYALTVSCIGKSSATWLSTREIRAWTQEMTAKHVWRLFVALEQRGLRDVTVDLFVKALDATSGKEAETELYRVHLTLDQLRTLPGWKTLDPYRTRSPSTDLYDGEQLDFVARLVRTWQVQVDNRAAIQVVRTNR